MQRDFFGANLLVRNGDLLSANNTLRHTELLHSQLGAIGLTGRNVPTELYIVIFTDKKKSLPLPN